MLDKKFAFESDEVSFAFYSVGGLGDAIIARKVFNAIVEIVPNCLVDYLCQEKRHEIFAQAFFGDSKNLNRLLTSQEYMTNAQKYDAALYVGGCHAIILEKVNADRLQAMAPNFLQALINIQNYNKNNVFSVGGWGTSVAFRNMISAKILNKNCYDFLSCDGALPIRDNKVTIPLRPEFKPAFDNLKLNNYITFYTDISENRKNNPKNKSWPVRYFVEYVARMKKRFPAVEIVQCGGNEDVKVENADRHLLGTGLELTKYILANSLLHIGCEGGLVHLATALGTKCLVLFGANTVEYVGYNQNINIVSDVCYPCMYTLPDYTLCLRGLKEPACMAGITPQLVCEITCNYLKHLDLKNNT